jgi:hypothetical protein
MEAALQHVEQTGELRVLTRTPLCVGALLDQGESHQALDWIGRIRKLLEGHTFKGVQAAHVASLRTAMMYRLRAIERAGPVPADATVGKLVGAWAGYAVKEIPIVKPDGYGQLIGAHPDPQHSGLLLACRQQGDDLSIERIGIGGGPLRRIGPNVPHRGHRAAGRRAVTIVRSSDAVFVASGAPGVAMLSGGQARFFGQEEGAPGTDVYAMAWLDGALYLSFPNSLARFDPGPGKFTLLASAHAVQPQNPLEGGGRYFIRTMLADPLRKCVWFVLDDLPEGRRYGVWKYTPESNEFERVFDPSRGYQMSNLSWASSELKSIFFCAASRARQIIVNGVAVDPPTRPSRWLLLDAHTGSVEELTGYAPFHLAREGRPQRPEFLKLGDHIIDANGRLYTPDGGEHLLPRRFPWGMLERYDRGFVAGDFNGSVQKVWYFEPRTNTHANAEP